MEVTNQTVTSDFPVFTSKLDYFGRQLPTDVSTQSEEIVRFNPTTPLSLDNQNIIQFEIPAHPSAFYNIKESSLYVRCKILKKAGGVLEATDMVAYCNNFLHTLFKNVTIYANNKIIYNAEGLYPYRSIIQKLCTTQYADKNSLFEIESTNGEAGGEDVTIRQPLVNLSAEFEMCGSLCTDLTEISKFIPNGVALNIRLEKSDDKFCLISNQDTKEYKIQILDCHFNLVRMNLLPSLFDVIQNKFEKEPARIPYKCVRLRTLGIQTGSFSAVHESLFNGRLPDKVVIGLVSATSFVGKLSQNPFNFKHFNVSRVGVSADVYQTVNNYVTYNFTSNQYIEGLIHFNRVVGNKKQLGVNRTTFKDGKTLHAFTLSLANSEHSLAPIKNGSVRIQIDFAQQTTEAIVCVVFGVFDNTLYIDRNRDISRDF